MDDISLALQSGYPDDLAYKLYERRAKINASLKDVDGACESYKLAIKYVDVASKINEEKKRKLKQEFLRSLKFFQDTPQSVRENLKKALKASQVETLTVENPNPQYPSLSQSVSFKYEQGRGRFAVATKDIEVNSS